LIFENTAGSRIDIPVDVRTVNKIEKPIIFSLSTMGIVLNPFLKQVVRLFLGLYEVL